MVTKGRNALIHVLRLIFIVLMSLVLPSCHTIGAGGTWHQKFNWKATDYFSTPLEVALCNAIEANDLDEMRRLIKQGADVNVRGKDNMTPLLWAFPDNKVERFKILLENGADPNVEVESDLNTRRIIIPGDSITHMSARTIFPEHFLLVMKHGGDPNLVHRRFEATPLHAVIESLVSDKSERIQLLIDAGADLEHWSVGSTPAKRAAGFRQYEVVQQLLEAGADFRAYGDGRLTRLIHVLAMSQPPHAPAYEKLIAWLEERGESLEEAKKDLARWDSWNGMDPKKAATLRKREIAERLAKEAAEKSNQQVQPPTE